MGLFDKFRGGRRVRGVDGTDPAADLRYLQQWVAEHTGEAFVEPRTTVTDVTVVLVAADGEWTRRRAGETRRPRLSDGSDSRLRRAESGLSAADAGLRRAQAD